MGSKRACSYNKSTAAANMRKLRVRVRNEKGHSGIERTNLKYADDHDFVMLCYLKTFKSEIVEHL